MANALKFDDSATWSTTAASGIPYQIQWENPADWQGQFRDEQFSLSFRIKTKHSTWWKFVRDMKGWSIPVGGSSPWLTRILPEKCPYPIQDPADAARTVPLYCVDLQADGAMDNGFAEDTTDPNYDPDFISPQPHPSWNKWPNPDRKSTR